MKTLILIWFISLTSLCYSQTILFKKAIPETIAEAIILSEVEITASKTALVINNQYLEESSKYLSSVFGKHIPENIKDIQRLIATYDIKALKEECPNCDGYKAVVEGLKDSKAVVFFDKTGKITETYETYKNVYPPLEVKDKLKSSHSHWSPSKSSFLYIFDKEPRSRYVVNIENKGDTEKLKSSD